MVMFWQIRETALGGAPAGRTPCTQCVRLAGSAFFIFGFADVSTYTETGRSSVCHFSLSRSSSNERSIGASLALAGEPGGCLPVMSYLAAPAQPGIPTTRSSFLSIKEGLNALTRSIER